MAHNSADIHIEIILILLVLHQYLCLSLMHTIDLITNALHHLTDSSQGNIYAALLALNQHNILRAELLLISANGHTANQKMQANKEKKYSNTSSLPLVHQILVFIQQYSFRQNLEIDKYYPQAHQASK